MCNSFFDRLNQAILSVQLELTTIDNKEMPAGSLTAPENNLLSTLFSKQLITLNECPVCFLGVRYKIKVIKFFIEF